MDAARRWQQAQSGAASPAAVARARPEAPAPRVGGAAAAAVGRGGDGGGRDGGDGAVGGLSLATVRRTAAVARAGDPERRLVRLIAEVGVDRAMALLPAPLARAVGAIHEVARMLGVARGR
jgi:hypothetical protein